MSRWLEEAVWGRGAPLISPPKQKPTDLSCLILALYTVYLYMCNLPAPLYLVVLATFPTPDPPLRVPRRPSIDFAPIYFFEFSRWNIKCGWIDWKFRAGTVELIFDWFNRLDNIFECRKHFFFKNCWTNQNLSCIPMWHKGWLTAVTFFKEFIFWRNS